MSNLPPWANGPFELLVHAEGHLRNDEDFDRRISLISFDNAIEVAITTYLSLHPIQRGNRQYEKSDVEKWLHNYYTRLDRELDRRGACWRVEKSHIIWAHQQRNEQYHGGSKGTPEKQVLAIIREAALWIFGVLFDAGNVLEEALEEAIRTSSPPMPPEREKSYDRAIDREYGMIDVAGVSYYASEILFAVDDIAYREEGVRLCDTPSAIEDDLTEDNNDEQ
ncbi:MAG: hypothetical protein GY835_24890 [bacterium]|nr:hypothetical protein [bacterium]